MTQLRLANKTEPSKRAPFFNGLFKMMPLLIFLRNDVSAEGNDPTPRSIKRRAL